MAWIIVLLMPLALFAQYTFGPVRLDDGTGELYSYSHVRQEPDGGFICTWALGTADVIGTYGQRIAPDGSLVGERICYESRVNDGFVCGATATIVRCTDGREGQLLHHP
jgi:hypothetical protein